MAQHPNSLFTALQATPTVGRTVKARDDGATRREIINALMSGGSPNAANTLQRLGRDQLLQQWRKKKLVTRQVDQQLRKYQKDLKAATAEAKREALLKKADAERRMRQKRDERKTGLEGDL